MRTLSPSLALSLVATVGFAPPAAGEPVRLVLLSAPAQAAALGQLLPSPLVVRVERASGESVPGVEVTFSPNGVLCWDPPLPGEPCPTAEWYGDFEGAPPATPNSIVVTSGVDGVATTPLFRVGAPPFDDLPFGFEMLASAPAQTTPDGFTITLQDATNPIGGLLAAATEVVVTAGGATAIPVLDGAGFVALVLLLAAASLWRLRQAR